VLQQRLAGRGGLQHGTAWRQIATHYDDVAGTVNRIVQRADGAVVPNLRVNNRLAQRLPARRYARRIRVTMEPLEQRQ